MQNSVRRSGRILRRLGAGVVLAGAALAALTGPAFAGPAAVAETPFEQAREEGGATNPPRTRYDLPYGELRVTSELLAAVYDQKIRLSVTLDRSVDRGSLLVTLPARWLAIPPSGLPTTRPPRLRRSADGRAALGRSGRTVELSLDGARAGQTAAFEVADLGIPAGDYRLPVSWRGADGRTEPVADVRISLYAPVREQSGAENPWAGLDAPRIESEATPMDTVEQSETFITVAPRDSDRILASANSISSTKPNEVAFLSGDAGKTWKTLTIPNAVDAPGKAMPEAGDYCCDPMSVGDDAGNIWFGGLSSANGAANPSRMFVNRIAAGTDSFQPLTVGLPLPEFGPNNSAQGAGQQDKNMMTLDNSPSSPTYGRLYVVWNDTGSGNQVIVSNCDTRQDGLPAVQRCDDADNWTKPAPVSARGSVIYADAAVGPDGKLYVTWWDFSSRNAIVGEVCDPTAASCATEAGFTPTQDIATLNDDLVPGVVGDEPLPFACPIPAQPGGRPGPASGVKTDVSNGPNRGRVYVVWGDLRPGRPGETRCQQLFVPGSPPNTVTDVTWDSFVASADGKLPGEAKPSREVATRLYTDEANPPEKDNLGNEGARNPEGVRDSDEWFAWLAVDQSTGQAYADFYSTRDDGTRRTTHFYFREVTPDAAAPGGHRLGQLTRASSKASDYSTGTTACCVFGNDYGDYTGLDAAEGFAYPVWTRRDNMNDDGDVFTFVPEGPNLQLVHKAIFVTEDSGANGNGQIEPGEPILLFEQVTNPSTVGATNVRGTINSLTPRATITSAFSPYPDIAPGSDAVNTTAFRARLAADIPCGSSVDFRIDLATDQGPESVVAMVPVCGPATSPPAGGGTTVLPPGGGGTSGDTSTTGTSTGGSATTTGGPTTTTGGPPPSTRPAATRGRRFLISRRAFALTRGGVARVRVACRQLTPCRGTMRLTTHARVRGRLRRVTLGRATFRVGPRRRGTVAVKLSRSSRRLLARITRTRVLAVANVRPEVGTSGPSRRSTSTATFRLVRPRR